MAHRTYETQEPLAIRLALAFAHVRARLREESGARSTGLPISQLSILRRLHRDGPATAASLAAAEHVSQQAIAQSVACLKSAGFVRSDPDPRDRRKALVSVTDAGLAIRDEVIASRNSWLARAIESSTDEEERAVLEKAIAVMERLADAAPGER
jgi:DNA-binding MarR family transcriptional regulator